MPATFASPAAITLVTWLKASQQCLAGLAEAGEDARSSSVCTNSSESYSFVAALHIDCRCAFVCSGKQLDSTEVYDLGSGLWTQSPSQSDQFPSDEQYELGNTEKPSQRWSDHQGN